MSLCILAGGAVTRLVTAAFTLWWNHSVEHIRWTEQWQVTPAGLAVVEARIEGSGAGMDPPEGALFDGSGWVYRPHVPPQKTLMLADSGVAGAWHLCVGDACRTLGGKGGDPIVLEACP